MKNIFTFSLLLCILFAGAQSPTLVKNINVVTTDASSHSDPGKGMLLNGQFYFPASNYNGRELWKTNGTGVGTNLVSDVFSIFEMQNSDPQHLRVIGNELFFFTNDGQFWKIDGTTNKLTGIGHISLPTEVVELNGKLYMDAELFSGQGVELIEYDPSINSLSIVQDLRSGADSSLPKNFTVYGDSLFFTANNGVHGRELWLYNDGTGATSFVRDIRSGPNPSNPSYLTMFDGELYFSANNGTTGRELWKSDGSFSGTQIVEDINFGADSSNPANITVFDGMLYFSADDGSNGIELWSSDGNSFGTFMVEDINEFGDSNPGLFGFQQLGASLFFAADDGNDGIELWMTDASSTSLVQNIHSSGNSNPQQMTVLGSQLIFVAASSNNAYELWKTNGTTTSMIQNTQPGSVTTVPQIMGVYNSAVYYAANNGTTGRELWKTDGTSPNTSLVKDIYLGTAINSDPSSLESFNNLVYFFARTAPGQGNSFYQSDGSTGGTVVVQAAGGADNFNPFLGLTKAGPLMYFNAGTTSAGFELWKTNGTGPGTVMVKDIFPGNGGSFPNDFIAAGSRVFFTATDGVNGRELWVSDGTPGGTQMVKNITAGSGNSSFREMTAFGNNLVFGTNDGTNGDELWFSDGTETGTIMLKNIAAGNASSAPASLRVIGSKLYFNADDVTNGREIWTSDGTPTGTVFFKDINPSGSSNASDFTELGGFVYFAATNNTANPAKVWRSDGAAINTSQFFDVNFPFFFRNIGSHIVFITLPAGSNGFRLWSTNGTMAGTTEIEDFLPGVVGYIILDNFLTWQGQFYMWIDDRISGQELWVTNGTAAGTTKYDIAGGSSSSYPRSAKGLNPVLFSANDGTITGRELWKLDLAAILPVSGLDFTVRKQSTNSSQLQWSTRTETNNKGFEIQRSFDGTHFSSIGFVDAKPNAANGGSYSFDDTKQKPGRHYYRLQQMDMNGNAKQSAIRWVDYDDAFVISAYPNPAKDVLNINIGYNLTNAELIIRTMSGQFVKRMTVNGNGTIAIPLNGLAAGMYAVEISEGSIRQKIVFVKQ